MLDQRLLREDPELIRLQLARRGLSPNLTELQGHALRQRDLETRRSDLQAEGNGVGRAVGELMRRGASGSDPLVQELREKGNRIKKQVSELEQEEKALEARLREALLSLPNLPSPHTPEGRSETDNVEVKRWGDPRPAGVELQEHWQIAECLGLLESERSVRIAQSRFVTLIGAGARLERALIAFMLDRHGARGYTELQPPILVNSASLTGSGQLPKFAEESFRCADDDLWLTPTAEVPVTSFHRDEVLAPELLPLRYVAHTPCFRREAGSYGRDTRGLIRLHQFNKVELYWFCRPEESDAAHEQLVRRPHLRSGGVAAGSRLLSRNLQLQHLRRLPGPAGQHPLPPGEGHLPGAYPQRQRPGDRSHHGRPARKRPAKRWQRAPARRPGALLRGRHAGGQLKGHPHRPIAQRRQRRPFAHHPQTLLDLLHRRQGGGDRATRRQHLPLALQREVGQLLLASP